MKLIKINTFWLSALALAGLKTSAQAGVLVLLLAHAASALAWDGTGTAANPYQIRNSADWAALADTIVSGYDTDGTVFCLMGDISISKPVGTSDHRFKGTFDGGGHTVTARLSVESGCTAPFAYVENATISHLHVDGTIHGGLHTAGITCSTTGTGNTISDCHVSANITTFAQNNIISAGGIVGHANTSTLTVEGCLFDGTITATSSVNASYAGAIVGWGTKSGMHISVKDCIENGTYTNINHAGFSYADDQSAASVPTDNCYTLNHNWSEVKHPYRIIYLSDSFEPSFNPVTTYPTTNITASEIGLKQDGIFYVGSGEQVAVSSDLSIESDFLGYCYSIEFNSLRHNDESNYDLFMMPDRDVYMALSRNSTNGFSGSGTEADPYLIENEEDWLVYTFTFPIFTHDSYPYFRLTDDIDIYTRAGFLMDNEDYCFTGVFDGDGHTITAHLTGGDYTAPFYKLNGGIIKNLHVAGDISGGLHSAGLVGGILGNGKQNLIENCRVSATITSSSTHAGGFVGHASSSNTTFRGCLFDGGFRGENLAYIGSFVGWCTNNGNGISLQDCTTHNERLSLGTTFIKDLVLDGTNTASVVGRCGSAINTYGTGQVGKVKREVQCITPAMHLSYDLTEGLTAPIEYSVSNLLSYGVGLMFTDDVFIVGGDEEHRFRILLDEGLNVSGVTGTNATILGPTTDNTYTLKNVTGNVSISGNLYSSVPFEGEGTEASPYLISSTPEWVKLSIDVAGGYSYVGKVFRLTQDIDCEGVIVGTDANYFSGTFDGDGHTLTLNVASTFFPASAAKAPFFRVGGATIRHLHTAGKIYTTGKYSAGIISQVFGTKATRLYDCHSSMTVYAAVDGDASNGGLVGAASNCDSLVIDRCTFTGNLLGQFGAKNCGGLVGWSNVPVTVRESLFDPDELTFGITVTVGANFARMADYSKLTTVDSYTTYNFSPENLMQPLNGRQGTFVVDELFAPQGGSYEFVGDPDMTFNGRGYYKSGCWIRTTLDASVPFDHWQDGTNGCFISDPWTRNGLHQLRDLSHKPSLGVWTSAIPEAETERTLWGVKYRYLSRRDYHFYISEEERKAKGWEFESDDSDANLIVKDSDNKASEITAVVGYDESNYNDDGVQIHNDLVGDWRNHTHLGLIAPHAFRNSTGLKSLYFKDTDANNYNTLLPFDFFIDLGSFEGCTNFKELKMMQYTTEGDNHWTGLEPTQVFRVADDAFSGCPDLKISVQADKYQGFLSSSTWKQHLNRFIVYEATTEDFTVAGVKYHWYRNFDQTEALKNDDDGKAKMMEQIRTWNGDYQEFNAATLLDTKEDCNVYYTSVVGVDDDDIDEEGGTMKIYNDPGSYYNYKTIVLNRDAIAGNTHVKNIEFWQTNGRSENSYSDLKMVIPNGAFKGCTNLKELRLFYYEQDGKDRWMPLGPKDVIPGDNIFGEPSEEEQIAAIKAQCNNTDRIMTQEDIDNLPTYIPKDFKILVSTELYPDFIEDPSWSLYSSFIEPVDYTPTSMNAFENGGLTYDYITSPGGILQTSQVVSQDISWWTAPRIAIEVLLAASAINKIASVVSGEAVMASESAKAGLETATARLQEATLVSGSQATLQSLVEQATKANPTQLFNWLSEKTLTQIGLSSTYASGLITTGILDSSGKFIVSGSSYTFFQAAAIPVLKELVKVAVKQSANDIIACRLAVEAAKLTLSRAVKNVIYQRIALGTYSALSTTAATASLVASTAWGGSGSYNADLMNKGMRENILSNIHQVGLVGGGYVITTPQKNLVYHTYIRNVADNVQDAVIYAGFDNDNNTNTSNRTMTFMPDAFKNKTNLKTVKFHDISNQSSNTGMPFLFTIPDSAFVGCTNLMEFSTLLNTDDNGTRALGPENFILGGDSIFAGLDSLKFHIIIDPLRKDDFLANESWKPLQRFFRYESAHPAAKYSEYGAQYAYAYEQNSIKKEHKVTGHLVEHTLVVGPDNDFINGHQGAVKLCNDIGTWNNYQMDEVMAEAFKDSKNLRSVSFTDLYGFGAIGDCYTDLRVHIGDRAFQGCSNMADLDLLYMVTDGDNHIEPMTPQMISIGKDVFKDSPARIKMMPQQVAWFEADSAWAKYKDRFMPCVIRFTDPAVRKALKDMAYYDPANTGTDPAFWDDYCDLARIAGAGFSWLDERFKPYRNDIRSFADFKYFESVGLDYVGNSWFRECQHLANIELPSTIKRIEEYAFMRCTNLKEIVLPASLTQIDQCGLDGCTNLHTIVVKGDVPATLGESVFFEHPELRIYVPADKVDVYKAAWSYYAQYIVSADTYQVNKVVTVDAPGQLASKLNLDLIKENSKVRYIEGPYSKYDSLTVRGPLNGEDIAVLRHMMGANAWESEPTDGRLRYLNLWDADLKKDDDNSYNGYGVDEYLEKDNWVGEYMFHNCNALESVVLPKTVTEIGENAFQEAFGLKRIAVGSNTTKYTRDLLQDLTGIEEVVFLTNNFASSESSDPWEAPIQQVYTLPSQIGNYLGDPALTRRAQSITSPFSSDEVMLTLADKGHFFPSSYLQLESAENIFSDNSDIKDLDEFYLFQNVKCLENTFANMGNLETITLPEGTESISATAFSGCPKLKTIHVSSVRTKTVEYTESQEGTEDTEEVKDSLQYILPTLAADAFESLPEDFQILVPKQYCKLYRERWAQYADHINPDKSYYADYEIITVTVTEPNTLAQKLGLTVTTDTHSLGSNGENIYFYNSLKGDYSKIHKLKIIGPISCGDLSVLRHLSGYTAWSDCRNMMAPLEYIDLYDADLVYTPYDCASDKYYSILAESGLMEKDVNNQLPPLAFLKAYNLKTLILPRTCTQVKTRALQECEALETLVIGDDCTDFNWNALDDDAMLTRLYILTTNKLSISTEDFIWRNLCNNYNPTFDAFYVRPSLYRDYLYDEAYTGSSWQRTNNISKGMFDDDESFCVFASHAAATMEDLTQVYSVKGWFDSHTGVKDLTALGYVAIDSLYASDMQKLTQLEKVTLPVTLEVIGDNAFSQSPNLRYADMLMLGDDLTADIKAKGFANYGIDTQQTLVYMPQTYGEARGTNIVVYNGTEFTAEKFRLVDDKDYCVPYAFEAGSVENTRPLAGKGKAYAAFLPYTVTLDVSKARAYKPTGREGRVITFTEVPGGEMEALKPYVIRLVGKKATLDCNEACTIPASTGALVTSENQWNMPGYVMRGTVNHIGNAEAVGLGALMLVDGEWTDVPANNENAYIAPFRAYMLESGNSSGVRQLTMSFEDAAPTDIDTIRTIDLDGTERYYDLNGRELPGKPEKGMYIHNGKKISVK